MARKPKGLPPDAGNAMALWSRTSTDFSEIERALGASLDGDHRAAIEFSIAVALQGMSKKRAGNSSNKTSESLSDVAETAILLSNKIVLSLNRGHARQLHRFLLSGRRKWDLRQIAENLLELAHAADAQVRRQPPKPARTGRPRSNDDWGVLVRDLANVFLKVRGKNPGISFATGRASGNFHDFVQAIFAEIPRAIRPSETALGPLIKRALKARKAA